MKSGFFVNARLSTPRWQKTQAAPPLGSAAELRGGEKVRLRRDRENRTRDLAKKLDRELDQNGWRMFVSGCVYTMTSGKGPQRRNAEVMLVETVRRWRDQVVDLLPERAVDLRRIVEAGLDRPEPPPRKEG